MEKDPVSSKVLCSRVIRTKLAIDAQERNPQIKNYLRVKAELESLKAELKMARSREFLERVKQCNHILFTGKDKHGRIKTKCLRCQITSDADDFLKLGEPYASQVRPLVYNLFHTEQHVEYFSVSGDFASADEAQECYNMIAKKHSLLEQDKEAQSYCQGLSADVSDESIEYCCSEETVDLRDPEEIAEEMRQYKLAYVPKVGN